MWMIYSKTTRRYWCDNQNDWTERLSATRYSRADKFNREYDRELPDNGEWVMM